MKSIISFPERGKWGNPKWRGNCSGHVQRELIEHFRPKLFVDICEGGGTSRDVCRDLGIEYRGFDLHTGTDFTSDYILRLLGFHADLVFSHPPYGAMIDYTGVGEFNNSILKQRDTSLCSIGDFIEKSQIMLLNQREATKDNGVYCTLIGDMRSKGAFRSFQADFINMMPKSELISVTIKTQHNCVSDNRQYNGNFVPILHEYLLIWKKDKKSIYQVAIDGLKEIKTHIAATWRSMIRIALMKLGGQGSLSQIYKEVESVADQKLSQNPTWQATVRRTLQQHYEAVERGVWALPSV